MGFLTIMGLADELAAWVVLAVVGVGVSDSIDHGPALGCARHVMRVAGRDRLRSGAAARVRARAVAS